MPTWFKWVLGLLGVGAAVAVVGDYVASKRKVYVSFDYENDRHYKFLLSAWHANNEFDFSFNDASSGEVQTNDVGRIKAALTQKIRDAEVLLVIVGEEANKTHRNWMSIGFRNWINFEIAKAREAGKRIVAVKIDRSYDAPDQLEGARASWAMSFSDESITKALRAA